jgi:hypothetical protein
MPDRLPIYRVVPQDTSTQRLVALGEQIFGLKEDFKLGETPDAKSLRNGKHVVELANASGAVWAADESQLWKPSVKGTLPTRSQAQSAARAFLKQNKLLPELRDPFALGKPIVASTQYALSKNGQRVNRPLDVHVTFPLLAGSIPVTGGGAGLTVTIGPKGKVIGFNGGWRTVTESFDAKAIPPSAAKAQFKELTGGMKVVNATVTLAYYAAPSFAGQEFLYPVYVCGGTGVFGKHRVPLRQILLAATDFGPPIRFPEPQAKRAKTARPGSTGKEDRKPDPTRIRRSLATAGTATRPWEAGTSWIGQSGGLAGSHDNAKGFVDEWAAAGWHIDFNWGDANAWESDWRRNDDTWVDNADFVFYTGHANMNGWVLSSPDDGWLDFSEVGAGPATPGDLWGQSDLEWVVVAACGPLQDDVISAGGGDVLARWDGAFDGLHTLLGYGAITNDNTDEGRKLAQYCKGGSTVIDSWFRCAREIQPSTNGASAPDGPTVWVGAMWVGKPGVDPVNDHAWDYGSVSADPTSPTWLAAMWTTC